MVFLDPQKGCSWMFLESLKFGFGGPQCGSQLSFRNLKVGCNWLFWTASR